MKKQNRRQFIQQASIGLCGALAGSSLLTACNSISPTQTNPFTQIGLQLYSIRDLLLQDPKTTIQTIAKIGYSHVETFGYAADSDTFWGLKTKELKKILTDHGLKTHSGHYDIRNYLEQDNTQPENIEKYLETASTLGQKYIIAPTTPKNKLNDLQTDDYKYMAEQLNKAGELAQQSGIQIGFHNHFWELREFANGTRGLDILLAFTEPSLVTFELDIFWINKAGLSPQSYFKKYPGRFALWHIKDISKTHPDIIVGPDYDDQPIDSILTKVKFTEVGTGTINYPLLQQSENEAGLKYAFVEQDQIYLPNQFESIQKSYEYVQKYLGR